MKTLLLSLAFLSTASFAKTVELPKVKIPSVTIERGASVRYILLTSYCLARASIWDEVNNGMDHSTKCGDRSTQLKYNASNGHVVEANSDGSFNLPALKETFSTSKKAILCVEVTGVEKVITDAYGTYAYTTPTKILRFCTQSGELPKWFNGSSNEMKADSLDSYVNALSKPVVLKAN